MDADSFLDAVAADHETELSRIGSSKVLYALTAGEMDAPAVFAAMASRSTAAADRLTEWATDESNEDAVATFEAAATALREDGSAIEDAAEAAGVDSSDDGPVSAGALFEAFSKLEETAERAGGLAAWTLIEDGIRGQAIAFFVGQADSPAADAFRARRSTVAAIQADATSLLDAVCEGASDWDRATEAATGTVGAAYDHYVERLEEMGIKVKPVC